MSTSSRGANKGSRHVSFLSKCQVIPWSDEEDDPISEELAQRAAEKDKKTKRRSRLNVFRSLGSSSNNGNWDDLDRDNSNGGNDSRDKNSKRCVSPSLPINKNPGPSHFEQVQMQRRKLVSPPPPAISPSSNSPLQSRIALAVASAQSQPSFASTSQHTMEQQSTETNLTKPRAIRKPLSLGQSMEDEVEGVDTIKNSIREDRKQGILHIPAVVNIQHSSTSVEKQPAVAAILNWKEEDDDEEEGGSEQTITSNSDLREEDLNQECVCANCEPKMMAALDPTYSTPWTRPARKKYLTDLKQAQIEGTKAIPKVPSLFNSDHLEVYSTPSVKEVKADEVDAKKGTTKMATLPSINISGDSVKDKSNLDDFETKKNDEAKSKQEEQRNPRLETKTLSNDSSSGLWIGGGGGGARAMMRQLEDAERQEKRASIQRTNSNSNEGGKAETRPMGAVKDTPIQPFTIPRRLSDNSPKSPTIDLPRTPSPPQKSEPRNKKVASPSKKEMEKEKDRENRHPSPSYLIRRELTLGIPVHSNTMSNLQKPSTTWPSHPPTRTPSPRLVAPTALYDIAEVPSNLSNNSVSGINSGGISSGNNTPRRAHSIGHQAQSKRISISAPNGDGKVKRSSSMSAHGAAAAAASQGNRKSLDSSTRLGLGVNLTQHAAQSGDSNDQGQTRFRHKAKNSISNLVARIKN